MEPTTLTTIFASAIGLLGVFKAEVRDREGRDFDAYIDWLRRQEHDQLVDLIVGNAELSRSLRTLVEDQHSHVMAKLAELDKVLSSVSRNIAEFQPLADAVIIESGLSDQAVSVLRQLNETDASRFLEIRFDGGAEYTILERGKGNLEIDDPRFIEDDLLTLCDLGLLRLDYNSQGDRIFVITRAGAAVGG